MEETGTNFLAQGWPLSVRHYRRRRPSLEKHPVIFHQAASAVNSLPVPDNPHPGRLGSCTLGKDGLIAFSPAKRKSEGHGVGETFPTYGFSKFGSTGMLS